MGVRGVCRDMGVRGVCRDMGVRGVCGEYLDDVSYVCEVRG